MMNEDDEIEYGCVEEARQGHRLIIENEGSNCVHYSVEFYGVQPVQWGNVLQQLSKRNGLVFQNSYVKFVFFLFVTIV